MNVEEAGKSFKEVYDFYVSKGCESEYWQNLCVAISQQCNKVAKIAFVIGGVTTGAAIGITCGIRKYKQKKLQSKKNYKR